MERNTEGEGASAASRQVASTEELSWNHAKEPWSYAHANKNTASTWTRGAGWQLWTGGEGYTGIGKTHSEADAQRLVACVNACAGIKNPAAIPQLIESAINFTSDWAKSVNREKLWRDLDNSLAAFDTPVPDAQQSPAASRENEDSF